MKTKWSAKMLAAGAICMAMSFLLSYVKLFSMPAGGSVTAASMLPLMLFSWLYGVGPGLIVGTAFGLLQFLQEPYIVHWAQVALDYPLAFAMMGIAGSFRRFNKPWSLPAGIIVACFGRFLCHLISGVVFFGSVITDGFWPTFLMSAGYNGGYMAVEATISALIAWLQPVQNMAKRLVKMS